MDDYDDEAPRRRYDLTETEVAALKAEALTAPPDRLREIITYLFEFVPVHGYAPYDPEYGDTRECVCGHNYDRHFDSYDNMSPVGCKYCSHDETGCPHFRQAPEEDEPDEVAP